MKHLTTILATIAVLFAVCTSTASFAQASSSAQVGATIVTPMTIAKVSDMEFEVSEKTASRRTAQKATASGASFFVKPASFAVSGYADYAYGVTVPQSVTMSSGSQEITIDNIIASSSSNQMLSATGTGMLSITGKPSIRPSGIVAAKEPAGTDNEEEFINGIPVTILYN